MDPKPVFVKLGGSLITEKDQPHTARPDVIERLAEEIARARLARPDLPLLLGHGSGSFGHRPAAHYGTRDGVSTAQDWLGFAEVWLEARTLNQIVIEALSRAGLPVIAFPPSAWLRSSGGSPEITDAHLITQALEHGLVPVVQGDVAFDTLRGGTILSTEDVFTALAPILRPRSILLAGVDAGVWADYPVCSHLISSLTQRDFDPVSSNLQGSAHTDVTGGMREKVMLMLTLTHQVPDLTAQIFSGIEPGNVYRAILGEDLGTTLRP